MSEENNITLDVEDLKEFDLMRNPEIRNSILEIVEEWKACRDKLCPDSGLKCNTCSDYNACEKRIYDELHKNKG